MATASLLDRYKAIQGRELGTNTALSSATSDEGNPYGQLSSAGKQYRQLEAGYGRALRILNHAARRGNADAALKSIDVRKQAMGDGLSPGGIRRSSEADVRLRNLTGSMGAAAGDLSRANATERQIGAEGIAPPEPAPNQNIGYNPDAGTYANNANPDLGGYATGEPTPSAIGILNSAAGRVKKWWERRRPF